MAQNLRAFNEFFRFMSPVSWSATEGTHHLRLSNTLLNGFMLKQKAPFVLEREKEFIPLPFNSTAHKPIPAWVCLPTEKSAGLSLPVALHLKQLSRKVAVQKKLVIEDSWRSLLESISSAIDADDKFVTEMLHSTQQELHEEPLLPRQDPHRKARKNRARLSEIIADVIFAENPTATLAAERTPKFASMDNWKKSLDSQTWTAMDDFPFSAVSMKNYLFLAKNISLMFL